MENVTTCLNRPFMMVGTIEDAEKADRLAGSS
jgi:hypothetical protein